MWNFFGLGGGRVSLTKWEVKEKGGLTGLPAHQEGGNFHFTRVFLKKADCYRCNNQETLKEEVDKLKKFCLAEENENSLGKESPKAETSV